jgi:hypothetical protein
VVLVKEDTIPLFCVLFESHIHTHNKTFLIHFATARRRYSSMLHVIGKHRASEVCDSIGLDWMEMTEFVSCQ